MVYGITTAANAGDLVPVGHYQNIIARMRPQALYNQLGVMMIPGTGTTVNVPTDNEADNGAFVSTAESAAFDRDAPAVSKVAMTLVKYTKKIDLTYELLEDEDSNVMSFLETYVAAGLAATYNSLMITAALAGGTAGEPFPATTIGTDDVVNLLYAVPADYARQNMAWVMARATEGYLRGLATATPFAFAPTPSGTPSVGSTGDLYGIPVYNDSNMPARATGQKSIIVGNWGFMGARIAGEYTFLRDPYTRACQWRGHPALLHPLRLCGSASGCVAVRYARLITVYLPGPTWGLSFGGMYGRNSRMHGAGRCEHQYTERGMPLKKGEKYQIDAAEAAKLAKAGYVSIAGGKVAPAVPKQAKDS